jgi:hypothetical protein
MQALGAEPFSRLAPQIAGQPTSAGVAAGENTPPNAFRLKRQQPPKALLRRAIEQQPLTFVPAPERGSNALFLAQGAGFSLSLEREGLTLLERHLLPAAASQKNGSKLASSAGANPSSEAAEFQSTTAHIDFVGANPQTKIEGLDPVAAYANYFVGNDPAEWRTHMAQYSRVRYKNLYPGIDLVYYGRKGSQLEYDLVVAPGADPGLIRLRVADGQEIHLDAAGNLPLESKDGRISLGRPMLYQDLDHGKRAIGGDFVQVARNEFAFKAETYDHTRPLIIDPTINLLYSTYAGGIHNDQAFGMTVDLQGNTYLTGWAASQDFPVTGNAYQTTRMTIGSYLYDVIVMKFDPSGTLLYSTFLGGAQNDQGGPIVANPDGSVYVAGFTQSSNFPVTSNAFQQVWGGGLDGFLTRISSDGSQLLYSTYLGGPGDEAITSMILNADGSLWMSGVASQAGLPASANAFQPQPNGIDNSFVAKAQFDTSGNLQLPYLTFIGGSQSGETNGPGEGWGSSLALDATGNVYIAGTTQSSNYPVTANAYEQPVTLSHGCENSPNPNTIGVVTKFSPDLSQMLYSTYFGGKTEDQNGFPVCNQVIGNIHLDAKGNIWLYGDTAESDFPVTSNAISSQLNGNGTAGQQAFLAELSADGTTLQYGTYLGGTGQDSDGSMVFDTAGDIWLTGSSNATNYPVTSDALQAQNTSGGFNFTLTELSSDASTILYSTYLGGTADNGANGINMAFDGSGDIHLSGSTGATSFPVTPDAFQPLFANGDIGPDGDDVFYTVLGAGTIGTVGPATGGNTGDSTVTISGAGFQSGATCQLVLNGTTITATSASVNAAGTAITCNFALSGASAGAYNVVVTNPNGGATLTSQGGFTVQSGGQPQLWVNVVGRPAIRVGVPSVVDVSYGNSGNVDAYMVGMQIDLPPTISATYSVGYDPALASGTQLTSSVATATGTRIPLMIPHLSAGESDSFQLSITDSTNADNYTITASTGLPWYTSQSAAVSELTAQSANFTPASACAPPLAGAPNVVDCLGPVLTAYNTAGNTAQQTQSLAGVLAQELSQAMTGFTPTVQSASMLTPTQVCSNCNEPLVVDNVDTSALTIGVGVFGTSINDVYQVNAPQCVLDSSGQTYTCTYTWPAGIPFQMGLFVNGNVFGKQATPGVFTEPLECFDQPIDVNPPTGGSVAVFTVKAVPCSINTAPVPYDPDVPPPPPGGGGGGATNPTTPPPPQIVITTYGPNGEIAGQTVSSIDPNDKDGANGDGSTNHYVNGVGAIPYAVYFENQATATAPASQVVVTDQLDPTKVDLTTLTLGAITFGTNVINLPSGTNNYNTTYALNSSLNVRIQGSLNQSTGLLKWTFTSIDPSTGLPPTDPTVGFLPPDANGVEGQASVLFNVMPLAAQPTGTQINNTASVVFDSNAAISTPTWLNTLDVTAPVSSVTALPAAEIATGSTATFTVNWSGTDVGSGIVSYNIYVSDNGGAFTLWQSAVTATSASYSGTLGHTYGFYSIATDGAGNVEATKTSADTSTTVTTALLVSTTMLTSSNSSITSGSSVTFTAVVTPPSGTATVPTGTVTFLNGTTTLGTGPLNGTGTATYTTTALPAGTDKGFPSSSSAHSEEGVV